MDQQTIDSYAYSLITLTDNICQEKEKEDLQTLQIA